MWLPFPVSRDNERKGGRPLHLNSQISVRHGHSTEFYHFCQDMFFVIYFSIPISTSPLVCVGQKIYPQMYMKKCSFLKTNDSIRTVWCYVGSVRDVYLPQLQAPSAHPHVAQVHPAVPQPGMMKIVVWVGRCVCECVIRCCFRCSEEEIWCCLMI